MRINSPASPCPSNGTVEYLGEYRHFDTIAVLKFGANNRVIVTPEPFTR